MKDKFLPVVACEAEPSKEERRADALIRARRAFASECLYDPPPDATLEERRAYALERARAAFAKPQNEDMGRVRERTWDYD